MADEPENGAASLGESCLVLTDMGFDPAEAQQALENASGDLAEAVAGLLNMSGLSSATAGGDEQALRELSSTDQRKESEEEDVLVDDSINEALLRSMEEDEDRIIAEAEEMRLFEAALASSLEQEVLDRQRRLELESDPNFDRGYVLRVPAGEEQQDAPGEGSGQQLPAAAEALPPRQSRPDSPAGGMARAAAASASRGAAEATEEPSAAASQRRRHGAEPKAERPPSAGGLVSLEDLEGWTSSEVLRPCLLPNLKLAPLAPLAAGSHGPDNRTTGSTSTRPERSMRGSTVASSSSPPLRAASSAILSGGSAVRAAAPGR